MKILKVLLVMVVLLYNHKTIYAMEKPEQYVFLKASIDNIQNFARELSKETEKKYNILKDPWMVERCLQVLGLNKHNTPLDVKYHFNLLREKLSKNDPSYAMVGRAYEQLMRMLLDFDDYLAELEKLATMNGKEVEAMELKDIDDKYQFIKNKNQLIKNTVASLEKSQRRYTVKKQPSVILQEFFDLPDAASHSIEKAYNSYMEKNSPHRLIALKSMNKVSSKYVKEKMLEVEKIRKIYEQYLKECGRF